LNYCSITEDWWSFQNEVLQETVPHRDDNSFTKQYTLGFETIFRSPALQSRKQSFVQTKREAGLDIPLQETAVTQRKGKVSFSNFAGQLILSFSLSTSSRQLNLLSL